MQRARGRQIGVIALEQRTYMHTTIKLEAQWSMPSASVGGHS